jgi:hypothetical protein
MPQDDQPKINIRISQAESKRVPALVAHLRQVVRAATCADGRIPRPVHLDHMEVLLAAASLRALLFDDTPSAQLIDFTRTHNLQIEVETVSTTSAMLLYSEVTPGKELHLSDLIASVLLDPEVRKDFKEEEPHEFISVIQEDCDVVRQLGEEQRRWAPISPDYMTKTESSVGHQPGTGIFQYAHITRKYVPLEHWGNEVVGMLAEIPIRRRNIICYVANKLGGVHYDSNRLPAKDADAREFKVLAEALDWKAEAVVHAGLILVFLSCVELIRTERIKDLYFSLLDFHERRQLRLCNGEKLPEKTSKEEAGQAPE